MSGETKVVNRVDLGGALGPLWIMGWFFTVGYLHLLHPNAWKAIVAAVVWPYFLGAALGH
jgi:hypothetical protein